MSGTSLGVTPGAGANIAGQSDTNGYFEQTVTIGNGASNVAAVDVGGNVGISDGGTATTKVAASVATDTIIKGTPGRLGRVLITTLGSNALVIWDSATGHTGTIIGYIAASAVAGTTASFQMPAAIGITVQGNGSNPAFTVSWS